MLLFRPFLSHFTRKLRHTPAELEETITKCLDSAMKTIDVIYDIYRVHTFFRCWFVPLVSRLCTGIKTNEKGGTTQRMSCLPRQRSSFPCRNWACVNERFRLRVLSKWLSRFSRPWMNLWLRANPSILSSITCASSEHRIIVATPVIRTTALLKRLPHRRQVIPTPFRQLSMLKRLLDRDLDSLGLIFQYVPLPLFFSRCDTDWIGMGVWVWIPGLLL